MNADASHELVVRVTAVGAAFVLEVTERAPGTTDPQDAVTTRDAVAGPWEARLALLDLEARLVSTGRAYSRHDVAAGGTHPLPFVPQTTRAHEPWPVPRRELPDGARFNHYHRRDGLSLIVMTIPRVRGTPSRSIVATLECYFQDAERFTRDERPLAEIGRVEVVHDHLAPGLLPHQWLKLHTKATGRGLKRLATQAQFATALGADWRATWLTIMRGAVSRALAGENTPVDEPPTPAPVYPEVIHGDAIVRAVRDPVGARLVREQLTEEAEDLLVGRGEMAIRRYFAHVRRGMAQSDLFTLRLVESVLLTKWALRSRNADLVLEEGRTVVRFLRELNHGEKTASLELAASGG